jgi:hypothetical protein
MNTSPRGRGTDPAEASPDLAHVGLVELRTYRQELNSEEERVSYWRRLVQARIDILTASSKSLDELTPEALLKALGDTATGSRRDALLRIRANDELPNLPGLSTLWTASVDPHDDVAVEAALASLRDVEKQLTEYRGALFERLGEATSELIARYRANPAACLDLV